MTADEVRDLHAAMLEAERAGYSPAQLQARMERDRDRLQLRLDALEAENRELRLAIAALTPRASGVRTAPIRLMRGGK